MEEITWVDIDAIHRLYSCPEVDEYNTLGIPEDVEETRNIVRPMIEYGTDGQRKIYAFKIIKKDSGDFIGMAGITLSADRFRLGEISYELFPEYWGHGYATETVRLLVGFGFDNLHLHKVEAGVATENVRSVRVLEKVGMTREGLRRKILPIRGEWKDNYHYAIIEDDPRDY